MQHDCIIKICIVGEAGVGKTSILNQYCNKKFNNQVKPTIGCDFTTTLKSFNNQTIRMQLWDIAGQQRFNSISKMYIRGALGILFLIGCIIICSAQNEDSLNQSLIWKKLIEDNCDLIDQKQIPCLLVQNKKDLIEQQKKQFQNIEYLNKFAEQHKFYSCFQASAKLNQNLDQIFQSILDEIVRRGIIKLSNSNQVKEKKKINKEKKSQCC